MSFLIYHSVPVSESWALVALLALVAMGWLFVGFARLHAEILRPVVYAMALLVFIDLEFRLNSRNALSKVMIAVNFQHNMWMPRTSNCRTPQRGFKQK